MLPKRTGKEIEDFGHPDDIHGIERKILCKNLMSERDVDDVRTGDDEDLVPVFSARDIYSQKSSSSSSSSNENRGGATIMRGKHQTGVKGCLNDYKASTKKLKILSRKQLMGYLFQKMEKQ